MAIMLEKGADWKAETDNRHHILFYRSNFVHLFRTLKVPMRIQAMNRSGTTPDCQTLCSLRENTAKGCPTWTGRALQRTALPYQTEQEV